MGCSYTYLLVQVEERVEALKSLIMQGYVCDVDVIENAAANLVSRIFDVVEKAVREADVDN